MVTRWSIFMISVWVRCVCVGGRGGPGLYPHQSVQALIGSGCGGAGSCSNPASPSGPLPVGRAVWKALQRFKRGDDEEERRRRRSRRKKKEHKRKTGTALSGLGIRANFGLASFVAPSLSYLSTCTQMNWEAAQRAKIKEQTKSGKASS